MKPDTDQNNKGCAGWVAIFAIIIFFIMMIYSMKENNSQRQTRTPTAAEPTYGSENILPEEYGGEWPFPGYEIAQLNCYTEEFGSIVRPVALIRIGTGIYGLNGVAMGVAGFKDLKTLLPRDHDTGIYELKGSLSIVDRAVKLCGFEE